MSREDSKGPKSTKPKGTFSKGQRPIEQKPESSRSATGKGASDHRLAPELRPTIQKSEDVPDQRRAPEVKQPIHEGEHVPDQRLAPELRQPIQKGEEVPSQRLAPEMDRPLQKGEDVPSRRLAPKLKQPVHRMKDVPDQRLSIPDSKTPEWTMGDAAGMASGGGEQEGLLAGRGDRPDYALGTASEGFDGMNVVRWKALEALGKPFELEVTVSRSREAGPLDLPAFLDQAASLRIASETRWRTIHGIIICAEEIERTKLLYFYRFIIAPPSYRMTQRIRYRTFVDSTLRDVLTSLLQNKSMQSQGGTGGLSEASEPSNPPSTSPSFDAYTAPMAKYRFAVSDDSRLDDDKLRAYVVQFAESDHDLFHRLLEEEGLTYFFEHADDAIVLVIVDKPGVVSPFSREERCRLRPDQRGTGVRERETVRSLRKEQRLLWGGTIARDWDPARSQAPQQAQAEDDVPAGGDSTRSADPALYTQNLFPSRDADVGEPCITPANLAVERRAAERNQLIGRSTVRALEPGLKVTLGDDGEIYDDQTIVITAVRTFATQLQPEDTILDEEPWGLNGRGHRGAVYENEFIALPEAVPYRPKLVTPRPRIHGIQTAVVSADEVSGDPPEIHIDERSWVRLRFPWDERAEEGKPSSCWVRVSQGWAGAGYGDLFVPRVGQEVLVAYLGGDPERPLVVGRVYNATHPVPYTKPTISTIKSKSSPDSDGYNELRFDDEAGAEEVYLQAEKNLNELVKANHSTSVGGDQSNSVGGDQSNTVQGKRTHKVGATEDNNIGSDRSMTIGGNEKYVIAADHFKFVGGSEARLVCGDRLCTVAGTETLVCGPRSVTVNGGDTLRVCGNRVIGVDGSQKRNIRGDDWLNVTGQRCENITGEHSMFSGECNRIEGPRFFARGGSGSITVEDNIIIDNGQGASISLVGSSIVIKAGNIIVAADGNVQVGAGSSVLLRGGDIQGLASIIKWN